MEKFLHTYQRTLDKGVFLYRVQERLMLYTIISVQSRRRHIRVCAVAFMFTHIHTLLKVESKKEAHRYLGECIKIFVSELNEDCGRKGAMFARIGSAFKLRDRDVRSCIIYIYNNSVEKKLFKRSVDDRWNFLAYSMQNNPFSDRIKSTASGSVKNSVARINYEFERGRFLNLAALRVIFKGLDKNESSQVIDYIITKYSFIDYQSTIDYFKDLSSMMLAIDSSTGKEYDITEDPGFYSEEPIVKMCHMARSRGLLDKDMKIYHLNPEQKRGLRDEFMFNVDGPVNQINRFLHI